MITLDKEEARRRKIERETATKCNRAIAYTHRRIADGKLKRPNTCDVCGERSLKIYATYPNGYDVPDVVRFKCGRCKNYKPSNAMINELCKAVIGGDSNTAVALASEIRGHL